jgi:hypothetical protein
MTSETESEFCGACFELDAADFAARMARLGVEATPIEVALALPTEAEIEACWDKMWGAA